MTSIINTEDQKPTWKDWAEKIGLIKTVASIFIGILVAYGAIQYNQAIFASDIKDLKENAVTASRRIDEIKSETVTKDIFEERTNNIREDIKDLRNEQREQNKRVLEQIARSK